jgi:hypothetical protein
VHRDRRGYRRIVFEDCALQLAKCGRRLQAELVREHPSRLTERLERLRLTAGAVEGEYELAAEPLAERVLGDERRKLTDEIRMATELQLGVDAVLEHGEAHLVEPSRLDLHEREVGGIGEGTSAPKPQRLRKES